MTLRIFKGQSGSMKAQSMALKLTMYEFDVELAPPGIECVHTIPVSLMERLQQASEQTRLKQLGESEFQNSVGNVLDCIINRILV